MDQILDLARELGYSIQQDERFIRTQLAQAAADEDEELQGLIGEFNLKRIAYNAENNKEGKDAEKLSRLDGEIREIYSRLMMNEHMAAYNDAKTELTSWSTRSPPSSPCPPRGRTRKASPPRAAAAIARAAAAVTEPAGINARRKEGDPHGGNDADDEAVF